MQNKELEADLSFIIDKHTEEEDDFSFTEIAALTDKIKLSAKKEDFGTAYNDFGLLYEAIHRSRGSHADKRIHPSSFMGECLRKLYYRFTDVVPTNEIEVVSPSVQRIFDVGTFWHIYLQNVFHKAGIQIAREQPVRSDYLMLNGRADSILMYKSKKYVGEIKSISGKGFWALQAPKPEHIDQATVYAKVLGIKEIIFIYINKELGLTKIFLAPASSKSFRIFTERVDLFKEYLSSKVLPEKVCANPIKPRARACEFCNHCFNDSQDNATTKEESIRTPQGNGAHKRTGAHKKVLLKRIPKAGKTRP